MPKKCESEFCCIGGINHSHITNGDKAGAMLHIIRAGAGHWN